MSMFSEMLLRLTVLLLLAALVRILTGSSKLARWVSLGQTFLFLQTLLQLFWQ